MPLFFLICFKIFIYPSSTTRSLNSDIYKPSYNGVLKNVQIGLHSVVNFGRQEIKQSAKCLDSLPPRPGKLY